MPKLKILAGLIALIVCIIYGSDTTPWLLIGAAGAVTGAWGLVETSLRKEDEHGEQRKSARAGSDQR